MRVTLERTVWPVEPRQLFKERHARKRQAVAREDLPRRRGQDGSVQVDARRRGLTVTSIAAVIDSHRPQVASVASVEVGEGLIDQALNGVQRRPVLGLVLQRGVIRILVPMSQPPAFVRGRDVAQGEVALHTKLVLAIRAAQQKSVPALVVKGS